jgi:predicted PurR-regulated permease PerM
LAFIFYPVYGKLLKYIPKWLPAKTTASLITCLIIVLLVMIPLIFVIILLTSEVREGYLFLQQFFSTSEGQLAGLPPVIGTWFAKYPYLKTLAGDLANQLIGLMQGVIKGVPNAALNIFVTAFSMYYFLKHGRELFDFVTALFPLAEGRQKQILKRFNDLSRGTILGQVVIAILQGILAGIGFAVLGVPNPVLWGTVTAIISTIPLLGAAIVWIPIMVYLFILASVNGEYWKAYSLLVYGTLVISTIDNILKPKIVGGSAKVHPLVILLGILGGIQLFGVLGIIIGPLFLTIFDVVLEIYKESIQ